MRGWRRHTIWNDNLLQEVPARFRGLYTVLLPVNYGLLVMFGLLGTLAVVGPAAPVAQVTSSLSYATIWTLMVGVTALATFAGLAFRRESLELYAGIFLIIGMSTYPIADAVLSITGDLRHASLSFGLFTFVLLPGWRTFDLVRVLRFRHAAALAAAAREADRKAEE